MVGARPITWLLMKKGDPVVEIGDDAHVGHYIRRKGRLVLVRWHRLCARWHRREQLRPAAQSPAQEHRNA